MSLEERRHYIARCPRCSQCKWVPEPKSKRFAAICPSIEYGTFHSYSAGGKGFSAYALTEKRISYTPELLRSVYACTMCGACDTACKTNFGDNVEPLDTLYELRARMVADGQALPEHRKLIESIRRNGNPFDKPRLERDAFASGLGIKDITREPADVFLHIGCSNAYDESQWEAIRLVIELLRDAGMDFGIAGNAEINSGGLAFDLGFRDDALKSAQAMADLIRASKASTVVTLCADSYAAFKNIYPRLGVSLDEARVLHISECLNELARAQQPSFRFAADTVMTYHDPCKLGRLSEPYIPWAGTWKTVLNVVYIADPPRQVLFGTNGNYEAPRKLLRQIEGASLVEMERSREVSYCCGAGGGAGEAFPDFAEQTARERIAEAESTGASVLVTSCAQCQRHLGDVARRAGSKLQVKGLLPLLAETRVKARSN